MKTKQSTKSDGMQQTFSGKTIYTYKCILKINILKHFLGKYFLFLKDMYLKYHIYVCNIICNLNT